MRLLFFLLISLNIQAFELEWNQFKTGKAQVGTWMENLAQTRSSRDDDKTSVSLTPYIAFSSEYEISAEHFIAPEIGYVIQQSENNIAKNIFFLRSDYIYQIEDWLSLRFGTSFIIINQSGTGGEDTLNNANTTDTYYIPSQSSRSYNQTLDVGLELKHKELSVIGHIYTFKPFDSDRRSYTFSVGLNYGFNWSEIL